MEQRVNKPSRLCRWWGHSLEEEASYYYSVDYCRRCHAQVDGNTGLREWLRVRIFVAGRSVREWFWSWRCWYKCNDCGKRFGRHDNRFDHIPF